MSGAGGPEAARIVDFISVPLGVATLHERYADVADDSARFALMSWFFEEQIAGFKPYLETLTREDAAGVPDDRHLGDGDDGGRGAPRAEALRPAQGRRDAAVGAGDRGGDRALPAARAGGAAQRHRAGARPLGADHVGGGDPADAAADLADRVDAGRRPRAARGDALRDDERARRLRRRGAARVTGPAKPGAGSGSGRGRRDLRVRVKTAKGRKLSSTLWLERQLNDPYVARARAEGYRSRAAFKLIEIDDRFGFLKPGARVVDLGCAPGGWVQVAVARVNALGEREGTGGGPGARHRPAAGRADRRGGALRARLPRRGGADAAVRGWLGGPADVVLSDMAAPASGHPQTDHLRIIALVEAAAEFAMDVLEPGGTFVAKVLAGGAEARRWSGAEPAPSPRCSTSSRRRAGRIPRRSTWWRRGSGGRPQRLSRQLAVADFLLLARSARCPRASRRRAGRQGGAASGSQWPSGTFGGGEAHQRLRAGERGVELGGLAGPERLVLRVGDEGRAADLAGDAGQVVASAPRAAGRRATVMR